MIQVKIECLNPGCKIDYKIDEVVINIEETLKTLTNEIIRVMNNRDLKKNDINMDLFAPSSLSISTSDSFTESLKIDPNKDE